MSLDQNQTLIVALLAYFAGRWVTRRVPWLRENSVPEAVTGGCLAAIFFSLLPLAGVTVTFENAWRDRLLLVFFATVGLSARWNKSFDLSSSSLDFLEPSRMQPAFELLQNFTFRRKLIIYRSNGHDVNKDIHIMSKRIDSIQRSGR